MFWTDVESKQQTQILTVLCSKTKHCSPTYNVRKAEVNHRMAVIDRYDHNDLVTMLCVHVKIKIKSLHNGR